MTQQILAELAWPPGSLTTDPWDDNSVGGEPSSLVLTVLYASRPSSRKPGCRTSRPA